MAVTSPLRYSHLLRRWKGRWQRLAAARLAQHRVPLRNSRPLISFTFDDFPATALSVGGATLEKFGARGTYYVSLGLLGTTVPTGEIIAREAFPSTVQRGHEVACHTFDHCHAWETPSSTFEASIRRNHEALQKLVPEARFITLSYPIGSPRPGNKRVSARHFAASRAGGQTFNSQRTDLRALKAFFLEQSRDRPEAIMAMIDATVAANGWLIFATHDVADNPTRYGCTPALFHAVVEHAAKSGATIAPVSMALREIGVGTEL